MVLVSMIAYTAFSQNNSVSMTLRTKQFNVDKQSLALQGYDAVTYFSGKPKKGNTAHTYNYNGVNYKFISATNLETFKSMTEKYEPAYGGWCAYAMGANGEKVEVDAETFKIINGKLYLFYNSFLNNTLPKWNEDEKKLKIKADANWKKIYP